MHLGEQHGGFPFSQSEGGYAICVSLWNYRPLVTKGSVIKSLRGREASSAMSPSHSSNQLVTSHPSAHGNKLSPLILWGALVSKASFSSIRIGCCKIFLVRLSKVRFTYVITPESREPHRERGDNLFLRCALIHGMHETSNAGWWAALVAVGPSLPVRFSTWIAMM